MTNELILLEVEARDRASAVFKSIEGSLGKFTGGLDNMRTALGRSGTDMEAAQAKAAALGRAHEAAAAQVKAAQADMVAAGGKVKEAQSAMADAAKLSGDEQKKASELAATAMQKASNDEQAALLTLQGALETSTKKHKEFQDAQSEMSARSEAVTKTMAGVGVATGAVAVGVGLLAVDSAKAAGDFQANMTKVATSAGEPVENLQKDSDAIMALARDTGATLESLTEGFYKVSSAGFHGADGMNVLKASQEGAKAEGADLETVSDAVSSSLIDYHLKASDAADVTSKLVAATAAGKMRFQDLASAMPAILPTASAAHVALSDILGDMASMTVHGESAQQASQNLADAIRHMENPTAQQAKQLALLGMTTTQLADDIKSKGLSGTLQEISTKITNMMPPGSDKVLLQMRTAMDSLTGPAKDLAQHLFDGSMTMKQYQKAALDLDPVSAKQASSFATLLGATHRIGDAQVSGSEVLQNYTQALAKATGDATGLNVALMLTGENAGTTNAAIKSVAGATADAQGNVKGWTEIQANFNTKLDKAKESFETVKVAIGTALLPILGTLMDKVSSFMGPIVDWISHNPQLAATILIVTGAVMGLIAVVAALTIAFTFLAANPIVLVITGIIIAIAALAFGVVQLVTHWNDVVKWITQIWGGFMNWLKQIIDGFVTWWNGVWAPVGAFFKTIWDDVVNWTKGAIGGFVQWWMSVWTPIETGFKAVWDGIVTVAKFVVTLLAAVLIGPIVGIVHLLGDAWNWLWKNAIKPAWDGIVDVMKVAWNWILGNVINPIVNYVKFVASIYVWLWQNVLVPVWNGIVDVFRTAWNWILTNVVQPIIDWYHKLADTFTWFWQNVVVPVWKGIQDAIAFAWNWIVQNVMNFIHTEITGLGIIFNWLHDDVIKPVWQAIQDAIGAAWNWLTQNVFDPIGKVIDGVGKGFDAMGQGIKKAWDGMKEAAKVPIQFVVDTIYNNGILPVWNNVAKTVGIAPIDPVHLNFATGGTVPGYSPGNDTVHAMLSPGEGVLVPQAVRALGGASGIDAINSMFGHGGGPSLKGGRQHFADGGVVGDIIGSIGNVVGGALNGLKDAALGGLRALAAPVVQGIEHLADGSLGSTGFGGLMDSGVHKIGDGFLSFLGGKDSTAAKSAGNANIGSPGAVSGDLAQWVAQAMSDAGVTGGDWLNGLETIAMHESGGNPNAANNWDSNAAAGDPSRGLMQTIGSTFEAYRSAALPDDIFDPVANIVAGIGYIRSRYGGIGNVPGLVSMSNGGPYVGYDSGGWLQPGITQVYNGTGKPERVISPDGAGPGGDAPSMVFNIDIHDINGTLDDRFVAKLEDALGKRMATWTLPSAGHMIRR
ncbi:MULTISPECIES: phage tail tape measure protein [Arthrobacter]|uniref:Phage tail tape measure protein n=1 Tax=Arthrobacter terricola TaxID=2547396 RepID=A0A4R5KQ78_9MICC|nr:MULTISPECIES: phage tail tape measure protein [Arthrobacter]MBT8160987.1 phage tail tape measure protein [Arthrobacter sp. GN70]TDF96850.1 phage tail tape measure protein [Arthrobacter terricola]